MHVDYICTLQVVTHFVIPHSRICGHLIEIFVEIEDLAASLGVLSWVRMNICCSTTQSRLLMV